MLNQVLAIITPPPPAQNNSVRSEASAAPNPNNNKTASTANAQAPDAFGALLARQIEDKRNLATKNSTAANATESKESANSATKSSADTANQTSQDQATAPTLGPDAASIALTAMLLGNQEFKAATSKVATDANASTAAQTQLPATDAAAIALAAGLAGQQAVAGTAIAVTGDAGGNGKSTAASTAKASVHLAGGVTSRDKLDPAASIAAKSDTAVQAGAKELASATPLKASISSELPGAMTPSAQALAQSASSLVAASMQSTTPANGNTTQATVAAPLGSNAWPAEFSQKITWISTQQNQAAELHLNPPGLGPISITINVADNQATAVFTSPHSEVRDAIESAMPKLRESMAESGIMLGNATVNDQAPRNNNPNNFMNQRTNNQASSGRGDSSSDLAPVSLPLPLANRHNGMVDTFA